VELLAEEVVETGGGDAFGSHRDLLALDGGTQRRIGGAPEGVLTAAALKCLGGEIQAKFEWRSDEERERARNMGVDVDDADRVYWTNDLASGQHIVFCATGVTDGELLRGVRFFGGGARTHSLVMNRARGLIRFLDTVHMFDPNQPARVRL